MLRKKIFPEERVEFLLVSKEEGHMHAKTLIKKKGPISFNSFQKKKKEKEKLFSTLKKSWKVRDGKPAQGDVRKKRSRIFAFSANRRCAFLSFRCERLLTKIYFVTKNRGGGTPGGVFFFSFS